MTSSPREAGARRLGSDVHYIRSAATVEARALGHPEVDVDHLLLALLVTGGPSARVLTGSGVEPAALRRAVVELQEQELLGLGVVAAAPPPATVRAADRIGATAVPLGSRAQDLLDETSYLGDDRGLLRAVLDDRGRRAERLLVRLGIDVDAVCARARDEPAGATVGATVDVERVDWSAADRALLAHRDPAPPGTTWLSTSHTQVVPAPAERVWALVSDPTRLPEWDALFSAVTVDADGVQRLTGNEGHVLEQTVVDREAGRRIDWLRSSHTGPAGAGLPDARTSVQVSLVAMGEVTLVRLRQDQPLRLRAPRRVWWWLLTRMTRSQLRVQTQGIAQAAG